MRYFPFRSGEQYKRPSMVRNAINAIKVAIQYCLRKFGYEIYHVPSRYETKCHDLIEQLETLYSDHLLEDMRRSDETGVRLLSDLIGITVGQALYESPNLWSI